VNLKQAGNESLQYQFWNRMSLKYNLDLQLPVQSVLFTTKVVRSNPVQGKVHSIHHFMKEFVSDLRQVGGFLWIFRFPPPIKIRQL
jgi:hypothetical protein